MPKKALILTTSYLPMIGGSEIAISEITKRLPDFEFDLITGRLDHSAPAREQHGNVHVYRVGSPASFANILLPKNLLPLSIFFKAWLLHRKNNYLFVHAYQASQAAGAAWLLKWLFPKLPFILTIQEGKNLATQSLITKFFRKLIVSKTDVVTVISEFLGKYIRALEPLTTIITIPNGVDPQLLSVQPNKSSEPIVFTASRLVEKNGVADLIKAMAIVNKSLPANLVIAGDGRLKESLVKLTKELGMESKVKFLGTIPQVQLGGHFAQAHVFVRPSYSEGLGSAFLEAMAAGVPIIATPVGGIPDFLKDGETGLFCQPGNPNDIADKILKLLTDQALAEHLRSKARELVRERYQWPIVAKQMEELYLRFSK